MSEFEEKARLRPEDIERLKSDEKKEFKEKIQARTHIFENCHKQPEIRALFKSGGWFRRLQDGLGEEPVNTNHENLIQHLETYKSIERFGVENKMALQGVLAKDILKAQAFRATYANMIADRIYDVVPYGRIYFKMIMGYYAVSRINFDRLFYHQLLSFLAVVIFALLIAGMGLPAAARSAVDNIFLGLSMIGIVAVYVVYNSVIHTFYKNAVEVNMTSISDKIRERIFHLITAEQTCFSRITTEENSAGSDNEWKERAGVWALAAVAFRWRVFLVKQFLDVGSHKTIRHYVWMHNYKIVGGVGLLTVLFMGAFILLAAGFVTVPETFPEWIRAVADPKAATFVAAMVGLAIAPSLFLWSANPGETMNEIAARISVADAGIDVDTPIDIIFHLVGRVSTAKNEGRRG